MIYEFYCKTCKKLKEIDCSVGEKEKNIPKCCGKQMKQVFRSKPIVLPGTLRKDCVR